MKFLSQKPKAEASSGSKHVVVLGSQKKKLASEAFSSSVDLSAEEAKDRVTD